DRSDRVDAVADQEVPRRADRTVLRLSAVEDRLDSQGTLVNFSRVFEWSPHGHVLAVLGDGLERGVEVEIHSLLWKYRKGPHIERRRKPANRVLINLITVRVVAFADDPDKGCPGVRVPQSFGARLRAENQRVVTFACRGRPRREREDGRDRPD